MTQEHLTSRLYFFARPDISYLEYLQYVENYIDKVGLSTQTIPKEIYLVK